MACAMSGSVGLYSKGLCIGHAPNRLAERLREFSFSLRGAVAIDPRVLEFGLANECGEPALVQRWTPCM